MYRRNDMQYKLNFYTDTFNMMKKPSQPTQLTVDSFFFYGNPVGFCYKHFIVVVVAVVLEY